MSQIPSVLTGQYADLWKELAPMADEDGQVVISNTDQFKIVTELAELGGVEIVTETPEELTVNILYEPEEVTDSRAVQAAAKPTKFADPD